MNNFQRLRVAVAALGALSLLALSSAFGRGLAPLSPVPLTLSAGACFRPFLCMLCLLRRQLPCRAVKGSYNVHSVV